MDIQIKVSGYTKVNKQVFDEIPPLVNEGVEEVADWLTEELKETLDQGDQSWPPLSEVTVFLKGGDSKPYSGGSMKRSVRKLVTDNKAEIGVLTPLDEKGRDMEMIMRVAEGGAYIRVTDKMRSFFAAKGRPLKADTLYIKVPPRPLFKKLEDPGTPDFEDEIDRVFGEVVDHIAKRI